MVGRLAEHGWHSLQPLPLPALQLNMLNFSLHVALVMMLGAREMTNSLISQKGHLQGTIAHSCSTFGITATTCHASLQDYIRPASHINPSHYSLLSVTGDSTCPWSLVPTVTPMQHLLLCHDLCDKVKTSYCAVTLPIGMLYFTVKPSSLDAELGFSS